ncbi:unsaturated rhamnogalacturonyl hydrolase [Pacificibacter maritimus]|uniref:Unsaturated rhamnogalacturonyl hydrolase n=1 Tax=Pacificibacter maritimus TaxID=762213 RepID=A0A3N4VCT9_9RHOB|nr:glycoside hydrolase family 88 protein [Pacificibacter maritimus]RPE71660.1 unsaturated rhamnogalacturonyl hydrolase [Pacificibacter maritimus]
MLLTYFDSYAAAHSPYKGGAWCYEDGLIYQGLVALFEATSDQRFLDHAQRMACAQVDENGVLKGYTLTDFNIDNIQPGRAMLDLFRLTNDPRYMRAADTLIAQLKDHPRTKSGNYWHKKRYPWQVWLDGLNMGLTFQIQYGLTVENDALVEDALTQLARAIDVTRVAENGLYAHAYDEARTQSWADPITGQNAAHWARAIGWMSMALIDACEMVGLDRARAAGILGPTQDLMQRLIALQTSGNLWLQVIDSPDLSGNYEETSASAMFALSLMAAQRLGIMPSATSCADAGRVGETAFHELVERMIDPNRAKYGIGFGQMVWVAGLGGYNGRNRDGSAQYYTMEDIVEDDAKGVGPLMRATAEFLSHKQVLPSLGCRYQPLATKAYG